MQIWLAEQISFLIFVILCIAAFIIQYWWLQKVKFARLPWRVWIFAVLLLGVGWYLSEQAGHWEWNRIKSLTQDFARLYGDEMEKRGHWKLPSDVVGNDPLYLNLIETEKTWEKLNPDVSDIYTLRKLPNGKNVFIVDSETDYNHNGIYDGEREQRTPVGEVYDEPDAGLERAFRGEANFDFVPITDRWGTWISAFEPLHDPSGHVEAVLGVDFDARNFITAIRNAKLRLISLAALLELMLLGASTLNSVLRAQIIEREKSGESLQLLASAVENARESVVITDAELNLPGPRILFVNPAFTQITGYSADEVLGKTPRILQGPRTDKTVLARLRGNLARGKTFEGETINYRKDGKDFNLEWQIAPIRNAGGKTTHFVAVQHDITARKCAEQKLSVEYAVNRILAESPSWEQAIRETLQTLCGILNWDVGIFWMMDHRASVLCCEEIWIAEEIKGDFKTANLQKTFARGSGIPGRAYASGEALWINDVTQMENFQRAAVAKQAELHTALAFPIFIGSGVGGVIEFFSREIRERDEDLLQSFNNVGNQLGQFFERKRVEEHLLQSQKMETVGRLAGGIAHEFNSIMTAIIGQSELLLEDLPSGSSLAKNAAEIRKAADRAATLTRQLLAYGRKQILQPQILDLNAIVVGMENMLLHLMGRNVQVSFNPDADLKRVRADAGQIEQVVINVAMNAADAMPNGGKLTLETRNVPLDNNYVSRFPDLKTGDYVMLAIADTGAGMSEEIKARVFEPFFTTKGVGKGTGLGLATCHGIIKQSDGHIAIYSELGRGTTVKIYLPPVEGEIKPPAQYKTSGDLPRGTETILLVEDDQSLREMASALLERLGYSVLAATNGVEAMKLVHQQGCGHIDLLFTDVVMPQMSGNELADRVRALHPQTKILFTSAYTESAIVHQGVLNPSVSLLQKPFTPSALAHKIREILNTESV